MMLRRAAVLLVMLAALLASSLSADAQPYPKPPTVGGNPTTPAVGETVTVNGTGCPPGGDVGFLVDGQPAGGTTADQSGNFSGSVTIPPGTSPGDHTITTTCGTVVQSLEVSVQPQVAAAPLARTGSSSTIPLARIGLVLVGLGSLIVLFVRRRRVRGAVL